MAQLKKARDWLKGKKTYVMGAAWVVLAVFTPADQYDQLMQFSPDEFKSVLEGGMVMSIRAALGVNGTSGTK